MEEEGGDYTPTPGHDLPDARGFFHFTHNVWTILVNALLDIAVIVIGKATVNMHSSQEDEDVDMSISLDHISRESSEEEAVKENDLVHQVYRMYVVD